MYHSSSHQPLSTNQISFKSEILFVDGRTDIVRRLRTEGVDYKKICRMSWHDSILKLLRGSHSANTDNLARPTVFSLQIEPALLICSTTRIFVNRHYKSPTANHQPLFQICITLPVESAPFFIPSTSFCSLSSWFTSSCAYHLITVNRFAVTIVLADRTNGRAYASLASVVDVSL